MDQAMLKKLTVFDPLQAASDAFLQSKAREEEAANEQASAISEAYEAGLEAGRKEAAVSAGAFADSVGAALASLDGSLAQARQEIEDSHAAALTKILETLLPALMAQRAGKEIGRVILMLVDKAAYGKLVVHVPPSLTAEIIDQIRPYAERIDLFENPNLTDGTTRMSWKGGGTDIDLNEAVQACLAVLQTDANTPTNEPASVAAPAAVASAEG